MLLLDRGANIEAIHKVCVNDADADNIRSLQLLSHACLSVCMCCVCKDGSTPLHYASYRGHVDVVRILLDRGANIEAIDNVSVKDDDDNIRSLQLLSHASLYVCMYVCMYVLCLLVWTHSCSQGFI